MRSADRRPDEDRRRRAGMMRVMTQSVSVEVVRIGRVRLMVTVLLGVTTACLGAAVLLSAGVGGGWTRIEALVYLMIAAGCFATSATTYFGLTRTAEALLLL